MENQNIDLENNLLEENIFKYSYKNQNYKKSNEYKKWIKEMNIKFNNSGKEIICNKDNIIIYSLYDDNSKYIKCPICNSSIYSCIYCNNSENRQNKKCCIKAYFKYYFKDKIKPLNLNIEINEFTEYFLLLYLIIPLFSSSLFIHGLMGRLYLDFKEEEDDYYDDYNNYNGLNFNICDPCCNFSILDVSIYLVQFLFTYIYAIFFLNIFLILIVLSIPFKLYPFMILFDWLA